MKNIYFDTTDFDEKFQKIIKETYPELIKKGLARAMFNLMRDCVMQAPTVPIREGWLRGSASIFVQNKLVGVSPYGKPGFATTNLAAAITAGKYVGTIIFNTPYAAKIHEGIGFKFREPSAGPKYLEAKLMGNGRSYMQEIADTIKAGAR
ncbi:MAG: hypothetical protein PHV55_08230 [Candidatus Omnitrophica bacterium]|nr:hypothetical protein [Candidatus Omnitrophota bacterium]